MLSGCRRVLSTSGFCLLLALACVPRHAAASVLSNGSGTGFCPKQSQALPQATPPELGASSAPPTPLGYRILSSLGHGYGAYPLGDLTAYAGSLVMTALKPISGSAFEVAPSTGNGCILHYFQYNAPSDGAFPSAGVIAVGDNFFGTTYSAGTAPHNGFGTVFRVSPTSFQVLHTFRCTVAKDGCYSTSALTYVSEMLYGTTQQGGVDGDGVVFAVSTAGKETVLHSFNGGSDGGAPLAGLAYVNGTLYGTASTGGAYGKGTVFSITPGGTFRVLHSFTGRDGQAPAAALIYANDRLYGTTKSGGSYGGGTLFEITTTGIDHVLHYFGSGTDGANPEAHLLYLNGALYGTTVAGGTQRMGTAFEVYGGKETILHDFGVAVPGTTDGVQPDSNLVYLGGAFYGTTTNGGANGTGTVYELR